MAIHVAVPVLGAEMASGFQAYVCLLWRYTLGSGARRSSLGFLHRVRPDPLSRGMGHGPPGAILGLGGCLFLVSAIGVLAEGALGRKVGGVWGWAWTMSWLLFWSNYLVDAWAQAGMIGASPFPKSMRPVDVLGWT